MSTGHDLLARSIPDLPPGTPIRFVRGKHHGEDMRLGQLVGYVRQEDATVLVFTENGNREVDTVKRWAFVEDFYEREHTHRFVSVNGRSTLDFNPDHPPIELIMSCPAPRSERGEWQMTTEVTNRITAAVEGILQDAWDNDQLVYREHPDQDTDSISRPSVRRRQEASATTQSGSTEENVAADPQNEQAQ